jgi:hypothetical protein
MGHKLWPCRPEHEYNVLGHFHITDIWAVPIKVVDGKKITQWMVRFEKVDLASRSWWIPLDTSEPHEYQAGEYECSKKICAECGSSSKEKYAQGWTCLNTECHEFFSFESGLPDYTQLEYNEAFLRERTSFQAVEPLCSLVPPLPTEEDMEVIRRTASFKRGMVCPRCSGCSRRIEWGGLRCEYPGCAFVHPLPFKAVTADQIRAESTASRKPFKDWEIGDAAMKWQKFNFPGHQARIAFFPDEDDEIIGWAMVLRPSLEICKSDDGPDQMFVGMQQSDIGLERTASKNRGMCIGCPLLWQELTAAGARGEELIRHFVTNFVSRITCAIIHSH